MLSEKLIQYLQTLNRYFKVRHSNSQAEEICCHSSGSGVYIAPKEMDVLNVWH